VTEWNLGVVTQLSPLKVRKNGDTQAVPTENAGVSMTGATVNVTECLVVTVEGRRFAQRIGA
jgi:hypothetical protein